MKKKKFCCALKVGNVLQNWGIWRSNFVQGLGYPKQASFCQKSRSSADKPGAFFRENEDAEIVERVLNTYFLNDLVIRGLLEMLYVKNASYRKAGAALDLSSSAAFRRVERFKKILMEEI